MEAQQAGASKMNEIGSTSGVPKRGRGRPRKETINAAAGEAVDPSLTKKRGRGRPRKETGPPPEKKSIIVRIGGRWDEVPELNLYYSGGYTRYIHNCDPDSFSCCDLLIAMMKMVADVDEVVPTRFWYHMHGEAYPGGLRIIQDDNDLSTMWENVMENNAKCACVFAQDLAVDPSENYEIPAAIPPPLGTFTPARLYDKAFEKQLQKELEGPIVLWEKEVSGEDWYVSAESVPRVYGA